MTSSSNAGVKYVPFSEATKVERLDSHTYRVNLIEAFCIGTVPNGGYTASCMLAAASAHLASRDQPDTLTTHFEYPTRSAVGPAIVVIDDVKLGGRLSTLHMTLWQGGLLPQAPWITPSVSRRIVLGYTSQINMRTYEGISMPTGWSITPAAELPALPDLEKLKAQGADDSWEEATLPMSWTTVRALRNWHIYLPRGEQETPGVLDMWIRLATGERVTQNMLAYVVDSHPYTMYTYMAPPVLRDLLQEPLKRSLGSEGGNKKKKTKDGEGAKDDDIPSASMWLPTLVMNMEAKAALPEEGVEWLTMRITSKQTKDGKFDLDVMVRDLEGELVALSHHVALIVSMEKNLGKRSSAPKAAL